MHIIRIALALLWCVHILLSWHANLDEGGNAANLVLLAIQAPLILISTGTCKYWRLCAVSIFAGASLLIVIDDFNPCDKRITWCGTPNHYTTSTILSILGLHIYAIRESHTWSAVTTGAVGITWLSTVLISTNIYNGMILSNFDNYEYLTFHMLTILLSVWDDDELLIIATTLGVLLNLYWVYAYPWKRGDLRHRTEYYDTQVIIGYMYWATLLNRVYQHGWFRPEVRVA